MRSVISKAHEEYNVHLFKTQHRGRGRHVEKTRTSIIACGYGYRFLSEHTCATENNVANKKKKIA